MSDENIDAYLYNESLMIEPRGCEASIQFPRKWPEINLVLPYLRTRSLNLLLCAVLRARTSNYSKNSYSPLETSPAFKLLETSPQTSQFANIPNISDHNISNLLKSSETVPPGSSSPSSISRNKFHELRRKLQRVFSSRRHEIVAFCESGPPRVLETLSSYESSSKMPTPPVNILPTLLSTSPLSGKRKRARSLDESLQQARQTYAILSPGDDTSFFQNTQDEYLHLQQDNVASSIQSVSTDSSDIKELLIKISSDMGKILSKMDKMSSEIDMIKNKLDDIEDKVELLNILISTVI